MNQPDLATFRLYMHNGEYRLALVSSKDGAEAIAKSMGHSSVQQNLAWPVEQAAHWFRKEWE